MKKNGILKGLCIGFIVLVILSWLIPLGTFEGGVFSKGLLAPIGLLNLFRIPLATLTNYAGFGFFILAIGGLYGVIAKTGVYEKMISSFANRFKGKEKRGLLVVILFFAILSAITGLQWMLFILVPLFMAIVLELGFNKLSALMATVGAILVGNIGSLYGFDVAGYVNYFFQVNADDQIFTKIVFLLIIIVLLYLFINKHNKKEVVTVEIKNLKETTNESKKEDKIAKTTKEVTKKEKVVKDTTKKTPAKKSSKAKTKAALKEDDKLIIKNNKNKSAMPLVIILVLTVTVLLIACFNWKYGANFTGFEEIYNIISSVKINGFSVITSILGAINPFGYWTMTEATMIIMLASTIIAWLYNIKMRDAFGAFLEGAKKLIPTALIVTIGSIIIYTMFGMTNGSSVYFTISNAILGLTENVHVIVTMIFSFVSGLFLNDFTYFIGYMSTPLTTMFTDVAVYPVMTFIMQSIYGLTMLLVPTSLVLIAGLTYLNISYKEYLKYIWKFLLQVLLVCFVVFVIMSLFL